MQNNKEFNYEIEKYNLRNDNYKGDLYALIEIGIFKYSRSTIVGDFELIEILEKNNYPLCNMEDMLEGYNLIQMLVNSKMIDKGIELIKHCRPNLDMPDSSGLSIRVILNNKLTQHYYKKYVSKDDIATACNAIDATDTMGYLKNLTHTVPRTYIKNYYKKQIEDIELLLVNELVENVLTWVNTFTAAENEFTRMTTGNQNIIPHFIHTVMGSHCLKMSQCKASAEYLISKLVAIEDIGAIFADSGHSTKFNAHFMMQIVKGNKLSIFSSEFQRIGLAGLAGLVDSLEYYPTQPYENLANTRITKMELFNLKNYAKQAQENLEKEVQIRIAEMELLVQYDKNRITSYYKSQIANIKIQLVTAHALLRNLQDKLPNIKERIKLKDLKQDQDIEYIENFLNPRKWLFALKEQIEHYFYQADVLPDQNDILSGLYIEQNAINMDSFLKELTKFLDNVAQTMTRLLPINLPSEVNLGNNEPFFERKSLLYYKPEIDNLSRDTEKIVNLLRTITQQLENKPAVDEGQDLVIKKLLTLLNVDEFKSELFLKLQHIGTSLYEYLRLIEEKVQLDHMNIPNKLKIYEENKNNIPGEFQFLYNEIKTIYSTTDNSKTEKMLTLLQILQAKCELYYEHSIDSIEIPFCTDPIQYDFSQPLD